MGLLSDTLGFIPFWRQGLRCANSSNGRYMFVALLSLSLPYSSLQVSGNPHYFYLEPSIYLAPFGLQLPFEILFNIFCR